MSRLLKSYWDSQRIVPKTDKFLGKDFQTGRGLTQVYPSSPIIFNIVVDAVVWAILDMDCGPQESQHGLVWADGDKNVILYANGGRVAGQDHKWVQDALTVMVAKFLIMVM